MKKLLSFTLILSLVLVCFASCSKSEEVKAVEAKIKAIGEISLDSEEVIEEAEKAYALLLGKDKGDVKNYEELKNARAELDSMKSLKDKAQELVDKYNKALSEYGNDYSEVSAVFEEIYEEMASVGEDKKEAYEEIISEVKEKEESYNALSEAAQNSAVSYINGFFEVNKGKDITVKEIGCIAQISDGIVYYLFAAVYEEGGKEEKVYSAARFTGTPTMESMLNSKDNFYRDEPASDKTDALIYGNVTIDVSAVLSEVTK